MNGDLLLDPCEGHGDNEDTAPATPGSSARRQRVRGASAVVVVAAAPVPALLCHDHGQQTSTWTCHPRAAHTHNELSSVLISGMKLFNNFSFALAADQLGSAATHRDIFHTYPSSW